MNSNKIMDDLSKLATNAMGVAKGARDEAKNTMDGWVDRMLAERALVTQEEHEALKAMVEKLQKDLTSAKSEITKLKKAQKAT